jgi:hypothetical protein
MDYNLTLHIGDMDDLCSCEGAHGSPESICFDKSVRKVNAPTKFVLGTSTEDVAKVISFYSTVV